MATTTISAVYPNTPGSRFDAAWYVDRHTPFATGLLAPLGLQRLTTTLGLAGLDGGEPPYWAISEMVFASRAQFDAAMAACGEQLFADIPNYTTVTPVLQVSQPAGHHE